MDYQSANNFSELLGVIKASRRRGLGEFSYHQLAEKFAFRSPRSIAMVLKGQRPPSTSMVKSVCDSLGVVGKDREFIFLLAEKTKNELKCISNTDVDRKIERYRTFKKNAATPLHIPGVLIEIAPEAPAELRSRIQEMLSELSFEFANLEQD